MRAAPMSGLAIALLGVLVLTPDTLLMRLSGLSGWAMLAWRGIGMGVVLLAAWALTAKDRRADVKALATWAGAGVILCQILNQSLFSLGVASAPVAVVLFGVAAVPVFSALFSRLLMGERTRPATWLAILLVLLGIGLAVSGKPAPGAALDLGTLFGAVAGLGVAASLAGSFVLIRATGGLSIPLTVGTGAVASALIGTTVAGTGAMTAGTLWPILLAAFVVLPVAFGAMSVASRLTHAANVSLILLLETVLGPLWVWAGIGETPTPRMILGGAIVVTTLAVYIGWQRRQGRRARLL